MVTTTVPSGRNIGGRNEPGRKWVVRTRNWPQKLLRENVADSRRASRELRRRIGARELPSSRNDGRSLRPRIGFQADGKKPAFPSGKSPSRRCSSGSAHSRRYLQAK